MKLRINPWASWRLSALSVRVAVLALASLFPEPDGSALAGEVPGWQVFRKEIQPVLREFCYDCHGDGANKGNVAFDEFKSDDVLLESHDLWLKALKNLRLIATTRPILAIRSAEPKAAACA